MIERRAEAPESVALDKLVMSRAFFVLMKERRIMYVSYVAKDHFVFLKSI